MTKRQFWQGDKSRNKQPYSAIKGRLADDLLLFSQFHLFVVIYDLNVTLRQESPRNFSMISIPPIAQNRPVWGDDNLNLGLQN
jgi:hypothetical protein